MYRLIHYRNGDVVFCYFLDSKIVQNKIISAEIQAPSFITAPYVNGHQIVQNKINQSQFSIG